MTTEDISFEQDIKNALSVLREGGIIVYPTDTIWGIGCDAANADAVKKIYDLKRRVESKSMLALVDSDAALERCVDDVPEVAWQLIEAAVRPLTIIYDHPKGVAQNLLADDGSLGIRITSERFSHELCRRLRHPLVSTSANISGEKAPASFKDISEEILKGADYVVSYRRDEDIKGVASNIIKVSAGGLFKIIR
ncbi:MAG: threonylcarbamoyl-AMP synthase [Bacteroides sp.]|nr:threonylcarbamoyl-AMP synthase [Bacteroides sp.]